MSVIPLSAKDRDSGEGAPDTTPTERPGTFDHNGAATKAVDEAVEKLFAAEEVPQEKDLDKLISKNVDKWQADRDEETSFAASRESREALQSRYADHGDLGQTLDAYIGWAKRFRDNPREAGLAFAESYALASPYGLKEHKPKAKVETYVDEGGKRYSGAKLSSIIEDAMENASSEKKAFAATAKQRQALREIFPSKTFDEAIATIVKIDADATRDPAGTAAQIAAGFGMDWTPRQQQAAAVRNTADAHIQHASTYLPGMNNPQLRARMAHIIQSPEFAPYVGDEQTTLANAHAVASQQMGRDQQGRRWVGDQLNAIERQDPGYARALYDTMTGVDKAFNQHAAKYGAHDEVSKFQAAMSWVEAKMTATHKRSVEKAKRAAPVKSSSGAIPAGSGKGSGLDAAISYAMCDWR